MILHNIAMSKGINQALQICVCFCHKINKRFMNRHQDHTYLLAGADLEILVWWGCTLYYNSCAHNVHKNLTTPTLNTLASTW